MSESATIRPLNPEELLRLVEALQRQVAELERQNADLRAELERLKRRQHRQAAPFSRETLAANHSGRGASRARGRSRTGPRHRWRP